MIITPFVYDAVTDIADDSFPFPLLYGRDEDNELDPKWESTGRDWFVDASGFGRSGEAALTPEAFATELRAYVVENPTHGFAITGVGQFQVYVGAFQREMK